MHLSAHVIKCYWSWLETTLSKRILKVVVMKCSLLRKEGYSWSNWGKQWKKLNNIADLKSKTSLTQRRDNNHCIRIWILWQGIVCANRCPAGTWGEGCNLTCDCYNGASCHHITGQCECQPGFQGDRVSAQCHILVQLCTDFNFITILQCLVDWAMHTTKADKVCFSCSPFLRLLVKWPFSMVSRTWYNFPRPVCVFCVMLCYVILCCYFVLYVL
jgi:hypothetical protein